MQEVTTGMREKEINSMKWMDREEQEKIYIKLKLQHRKMLKY